MNLRDVERRAFDVAASSIVRSFEVKLWELDGRRIVLPFYSEAQPESIYSFKTQVEVPFTDYTWYFKAVLAGNALLKLNGKPHAGLDEVHTYATIPHGYHSLELEVSPRTLFGSHEWRIAFEKAYLVEVVRDVLDTGLLVLELLRFLEALPRDSELRRCLEELLYETLMEVRVNPSLRQVTLLYTLLYESPHGAQRRELPRKRWDYEWLAKTYGIGVLKGYIEDVEATDPAVALKEASRIKSALESRLEELLKKYPKEGVIYAVAHSHIDAAWLWPISETRRKLLRTFSTVTRLLKDHEAVYVQSSAQYYEWVEESDRELFEEIRKLVELGKWIPVGGMWVESDTNLVEGECLARQFLYGQRYFLEKFGRISRIGWLPDSFGFSGNLPQILRKSGIEVFITQKLVWNDINEFPYHTFSWIGIDGTSIPVQILVTNYDESATLSSIYGYWVKYKQKNEVPFTVYAYGYGNGGGGPTEEMVKYIELASKVPGIPYVKPISEADYVAEVKGLEYKLPTWRGELYLEFHRGTYTTNIAVKNAIAEAEAVITLAEAITTALEATSGQRVDSVERDLRTLWKKLLLSEFHDILPGSSIKEVYDEVLEDLKGVDERSRKLLRDTVSRKLREGDGKTLVVASAIPWSYKVVVKIPKVGVPEGSECQEDVDGYYVTLEAGPLGIRTYRLVNKPCSAKNGVKARETGSTLVLENDYLKVSINESGDLESLQLKDGTELLREPAKLLVHVDKPGVFDAWELTSDFLNQGTEMELLEKPKLVANGPLVSCVEVTKRFEKSVVKQWFCIYRDIPVVEVSSTLRWFSKGVLVKHWFKTTVNSTRAVFEIPFGAIERSTKFETSLEKAMFEVPALRWVDVSDGAKGLALISPSRHGYSVIRGDIGLSVIRSPVFPNPWSDVGEFRVVYYIYPHKGDLWTAKVPKIARELVFKPFVEVVDGFTENLEVLRVDPPLAILSAFKKAHDGNGYILRLFNPYGSSISVKVSLGFKVKEVVETNIIETEVVEKVAERTKVFKVNLGPYEVKTLRLVVEA